MYIYQRLCKLCGESSNDSIIAHYLLTHINSLSSLSIKDIIKDVGVSRALLFRFYHKAGYQSFDDLISILNNELRHQKYIFMVILMRYIIYKI